MDKIRANKRLGTVIVSGVIAIRVIAAPLFLYTFMNNLTTWTLGIFLLAVATDALDACLFKSYSGTETPEIVFNVYLENNGESIVVEVRDNGIGMSEETKAKVFTPFFTTKELSGTGLGLALTSRIVRLHGGEIGVESEPQRGSRFRIVLPVERMSTNQGAKDGQESPGGR